MYPYRKYFPSFEIPKLAGITDRLPTLSRTLDTYFDAHFDEIIEEWELLTDHELRSLEKRLETVTAEIDNLYREKPALEERALRLEKEIEALGGIL